MGSPCLFTRRQVLKMGHSCWLHVKNLNHLHTELSLYYLKDTKFYLESKTSFIHMSSIASFKPFLIAWLRIIALFQTVPGLAWSPRLGQNNKVWSYFAIKNKVLLSNFFPSSNMFFIRLFLANSNKKLSIYFAVELSLRDITLVFSCGRANDSKIVCSRDVQCTWKRNNCSKCQICKQVDNIFFLTSL